MDFSFFSNGFDMKCRQEFHGEKVRTWFGDVSEEQPSHSRERAVHVLAESRHHEEFCIEPLGVAVGLLLQQLEGILLIISPDDDLINRRQNSDFETGPRDCWRGRGFLLFFLGS